MGDIRRVEYQGEHVGLLQRHLYLLNQTISKLREATKKVPPLVVRPLRRCGGGSKGRNTNEKKNVFETLSITTKLEGGGGVKALLVGPLVEKHLLRLP